MQTLLLNADYSPLRIISLKRAVVLVLQDKAEIIEASDMLVRSASFHMNLPSVLKLKYFVKIPYRAKIPLNNKAVLVRDNYECAYCDDRKATTVDHVKPRSRGGKHDWSNVVAACSKCNHTKSDMTLEELGWKCKHKPYVPTGTKWLILGLKSGVVKEEWGDYLALI